MQPVQLQGAYLDLTTPHVADACIPSRYSGSLRPGGYAAVVERHAPGRPRLPGTALRQR